MFKHEVFYTFLVLITGKSVKKHVSSTHKADTESGCGVKKVEGYKNNALVMKIEHEGKILGENGKFYEKSIEYHKESFFLSRLWDNGEFLDLIMNKKDKFLIFNDSGLEWSNKLCDFNWTVELNGNDKFRIRHGNKCLTVFEEYIVVRKCYSAVFNPKNSKQSFSIKLKTPEKILENTRKILSYYENKPKSKIKKKMEKETHNPNKRCRCYDDSSQQSSSSESYQYSDTTSSNNDCNDKNF